MINRKTLFSLLLILCCTYGSLFGFGLTYSSLKCPEQISPAPFSLQGLQADGTASVDNPCRKLALLTPESDQNAIIKSRTIRYSDNGIDKEPMVTSEKEDRVSGETLRNIANQDRFRYLLIGIMLGFAFVSYQVIARILAV